MKKKLKLSIVLLFLFLLFLFFLIKSLAKTREDSSHPFVEVYSEGSSKMNQLTIPFDSNDELEDLSTKEELARDIIFSSNNQNELLPNEPLDSFVSGELSWGYGDEQHPLKNTLVRIKYTNRAGVTFPQFVYTDENGCFSTTIKLSETHTVCLQIHTEGKNTIVKNNLISSSYSVKTESKILNPAETISFKHIITVDNTNQTTWKAFQVCQALNIGVRYVESITTQYSPSVTCLYPKDGSQYDPFLDVIELEEEDYLYWDVILHEFGHKIQHHYGITDSPGGHHSITEDLITRYGKNTGIKLAWGEGWATFFGVLITQYFGDELKNISNINDEEYNSSEVWGKSLEKPSETVLCEGNELSIVAVLYDLYDPYTANEPWDTISFSHSEIFAAVIQSGATTFSEFLNYFISNYYSANDGAVGKILAEYGMASTDFRISSGTLSSLTPPTFCWEAGGSTSCEYNEFQLVFYNSNQMISLLTTERQTETTLTLSKELWEKILDLEAIKFYVAVISYQTSSPMTGPYYSRQLEVLRPEDAQHIHIYTYKSINSRIHQVTCGCGESFEQSHNFIPEKLGQRCTYCNYYANAEVIIPGIKNKVKSTNIVMYLEKNFISMR